MRTPDEIKAIVEGAFKPMRCVVEIWDYDHRLRFKVFDQEGRGVVEMPELLLRNLRDESQLRDVLTIARDRVPDKGFQLAPWDLK